MGSVIRLNRKGVVESGFTLVEVLVTIVVAFVLSGAVYSVYKVQQRSSTAQGQVAEMQQNVRTAFYFLSHDLRMAGYDPTGDADAGLTTATAGRLRFTQDVTDNPGTGESDGDVADAGENVVFGFAAADDGNDDGIPDAGGVAALTMNGQAIAENIERIQFFYTLNDGTLPANPLAPTAAEMDDVATITISILARSGQIDPTYVDNGTYTLADGTVIPAANDNFRRRLLVSEIALRNLVM